MSEIRVDSIESFDTSQVVVSFGASVSGIITGSGGINVSGVVTASSFSGSGSGLTNLSIATEGKTIAFSLIN